MPNFFLVGAARSGTTSLDRYLSQHPEIYISPRKETHFFAANYFCPGFRGPGDEKLNSLLIQDEDQYARLFTGVTKEKAIGETSAFYLSFSGTEERIAHAVPDAKIIILLREPVARAHSAYMHLIREGREHLGFAEGLSKEEERKRTGFEPIWWYKELSLYYSQVKRYLDVFGAKQVKVLLYDELNTHPEQMLRDVFAFLRVKENVPINTSVRYNVGGMPKSRRLYTILHNITDKPGVLTRHIKPLVPLHLRMAWSNKAMDMLVRPIPLDPQLYIQLKTCFTEDVGKLEDLLHRNLLCWHYRESSIVQ